VQQNFIIKQTLVSKMKYFMKKYAIDLFKRMIIFQNLTVREISQMFQIEDEFKID
jgi:hypothetical protein